MKKLLVVALLAGVVLAVGLANQAFAAVSLNPGDNVVSVADSIPASTLWASLTIPFDLTSGSGNKIKGTLYEEVRRETGTNQLIFVYKVDNTGSGVAYDSFGRVTATSFTGFTTDVAYESASSIPDHFTRSTNGSVVGFIYGNGIPTGGDSVKMWIKTNAYLYGPGGTSIINGVTADLNTYGPKPGTPEPSSMVLLGLGLVGMCGRALRKKFTA